jgi:hypothetical protein
MGGKICQDAKGVKIDFLHANQRHCGGKQRADGQENGRQEKGTRTMDARNVATRRNVEVLCGCPKFPIFLSLICITP